MKKIDLVELLLILLPYFYPSFCQEIAENGVCEKEGGCEGGEMPVKNQNPTDDDYPW